MAEKKVLVIGYYGDGNTGDEAVLTSMMRGLGSRRPGVRFIVPAYSASPDRLRQAHGVESFPFRDIGRMFDAVDAADLVILGGGGLLHDYQDPRPETMLTADHFGLSYYCGIPWLASRLGKRVMLYSVGVGPLFYPASRDLTRDVAGAASAITVRDAASAELLKALGGEGLPVEVTADPVWRLDPLAGDARERLLAELGLAGGRWLGVAVRNWNLGTDQARWEESVLDGAEAFAAKHGLGLLFLPFQHAKTGLQNDLDLALRLRSRVRKVPAAVLERPCTPEELAGVLGSCEILAGMRLHSLLFACMTGTPFVALDYDPKIPLHARLLAPAPPVLPIGEVTARLLRRALEGVWAERGAWGERGRALARAMRERAARNDELAAGLLDQPAAVLPRALRHRILDLLREREDVRRSGAPAGDPLRAPAWPPAQPAPDLPLRISPVVRILAPAFFDPRGEGVYRGGAERYLVELARVIRDLGHSVEVYQPAEGEPWIREHDGFPVMGLVVRDYLALERAVHTATGTRPLLTLHLAFYTAGPDTPRPALGISHGVYWDDPGTQTETQFQWHRARVLQSLEHLDAAVSVDTNTINWVGTMSARLAGKLSYIPNFVDLDEFRPASSRDDGRLVLLFPRRLVAARGFWLAAEILPELLEHFPQVDIHFIGEASGDEEGEVRRLMAAHPGRVRWSSLPPESMPEAYREADVVLIPTLYSEGTSLSLLEAQASGRAVVATRVGGLTDLVLPDYNGLLIEPEAAALRAAVERLILDRDLRERLARNGLETVRGFGIDRWRERWEALLRTYLPPGPEGWKNRGDAMKEKRPDEPGSAAELAALRAHMAHWQGALARLRAEAAEREIRDRLVLLEKDSTIAAARRALAQRQEDCQAELRKKEELARERDELARKCDELIHKGTALTSKDEELLQGVRALQEALETLEHERDALREQRDLLLSERNDVAHRLGELERTIAWRLVSRFWRLMRTLFPEGSRRRAVYRAVRRLTGRLLGMREARQLTWAAPQVTVPVAQSGGAAAASAPPQPAPDPRADLLRFEDRVRESGARRVVAIFSATQLLESEGQRPTQLALTLARQGIPVVFVYWRWWDTEWRPQDRLEDGIVQVPIDVVAQRPEMVTGAFQELERIALFEFPWPGFFETLAAASSAGWITIYDVLDDWEEFHRVGQAIWYDEAFERHMIDATDAVFAINEVLAGRIRDLGGTGVEVVGNGLKPGLEVVREARPLARGEVTVGYFGHLAGAWFDWELIAEAARRRPAWRFYLIGYGGSPEGGRLPETVQLLGKQPQRDLAAYAANWDAAIIPFKPDRLAAGADPIKTYEYLAMGLPVVATGVHPPAGGEAFVTRAEGVEGFVRALEGAAARKDPAEVEARRAFAASCTWDHRLECLLASVEQGRQRIREKRALFSTRS